MSVSPVVSNMTEFGARAPRAWPTSDKKVWKWWLHLVTNGEEEIRSQSRPDTLNTQGPGPSVVTRGASCQAGPNKIGYKAY